MSEQRVSVRPDNFTEGSAFLDDVDATITDIRFVMYDYDGTVMPPVPIARIIYEVDGEEMSPDLLSVGGKGDFVPDDTGMGLIFLRSKEKLTKKNKFGMYMKSLVRAGFPLNKIDEFDISCLVGLTGHFVREAVVFSGVPKKGDRDNTVLLCAKVIKLPWENDGKKGKAKGKTTAKVDNELADALTPIIQGILVEADGQLTKKTMESLIFKSDDIKAMDNKLGALKLAKDDTFLKSRDEWTFTDGVLKLA